MKEMQFSIVVLMVLMCSALIVLMPESVRNNKVINRSRWLMVGALALIGLQFLIQYITQLRTIGVTQAVLVNLIVLLPASALMDLAILNLQRWGRLIEVERWGWIVAWAIVTGGLTIAVVSDGKPFAQLSERVWWAEIAMSAVYAAMQACYSVLQLKELTRMQADIENYYDSQNKGLTGWLKYAIGVNGLLAVFVPMLIFGPNILLLVFALLFFWGIFMMWFCFVRYFVSNAMSRVREAEKSAEESARKQQEQKSENSSLTTEEDTLSAETMQQVDMAVERWIAANGHLQAGITSPIAADAMGIPCYQLTAWVKATGHKSFTRWITDLRMEEAKRVMKKYPDWNNEAVADHCGFSREHFQKIFKKEAGFNPSNVSEMLIMALLMTTAVGCTLNHHPSPLTSHSSTLNNNGYNQADSIVSEIGDQRDFTRLLAVVDSFEKTGELTQVRTIFYRTIAYNIMGQQSTSLRLYYQLAGINAKDLTTQADLDSYVYSYNNYVRLLCDMQRYDRALREAYTADRKLKEAGYEGFADHHDIAQIIGECQLYMDQAELAAKSFQKSLKGVHERLAVNHAPLDYRECQKTMNAIVRAYIHKACYADAEQWIRVQDSLYVLADKSPQRDSVFMDEMKADISYSKALLAISLDRKDDAKQAYDEYLKTNTSKELGSIINSNEYLMLTQHYNEAARNYELLDHYLKDGGYKVTLDNLGRFMLPKFRANLLAGRRDSALAIAEKVADNYNTALVRQKLIDADLLTTIYDTEGKERQIAEQRAKLSHQRMLSVGIVMGIILFFCLIYIFQRRRDFKKLNETNQQLVLANERAEESARMKSKFLKQITHEVRTPLNVLSGFSQVLADLDFEITYEELQEISQKIVENSERITHLIDKMLDLSLINSQTAIDCNDNIRAIEVATLAIERSGIRQADHLDLQVQVAPEAEELTIMTHRESAVKALTLLLDNAIKFTHPSVFKGTNPSPLTSQHVTLSISKTQNNVHFVVEDTGIGIPPEQAENIFMEFVQLDDYTDGTGIGLPIARSLARQMGGDITLDTTYDTGARFIMTLPLG